MRTAIGALALLVTVASVTGCDTDQPLQIDSQTVDLQISAPSAIVPVYDSWTVFEDKNGNGLSDDDYDGDGTDDEYVWCQVPTSGRTTTASSSPWPFSLDVKVFRDGATEPETITSPGSVSGIGNLASYDTNFSVGGFKPALVVTHPRGICSANVELVCDPSNPDTIACSANDAGFCHPRGTCRNDPTILCNPLDAGAQGCSATGSCDADPGVETRTFVFTNGRKLSGSSFEVLSSVTNPLFELNPETNCPDENVGICIASGAGAGTCNGQPTETCNPTQYTRCPGVDFGPAMIDGGPSPLSIAIGNGDTVVVRARRLSSGPLGFSPLTSPGLSSTFRVDGQVVSVEGSVSQSATDPTGSIDFFFTSR